MLSICNQILMFLVRFLNQTSPTNSENLVTLCNHIWTSGTGGQDYDLKNCEIKKGTKRQTTLAFCHKRVEDLAFIVLIWLKNKPDYRKKHPFLFNVTEGKR